MIHVAIKLVFRTLSFALALSNCLQQLPLEDFQHLHRKWYQIQVVFAFLRSSVMQELGFVKNYPLTFIHIVCVLPTFAVTNFSHFASKLPSLSVLYAFLRITGHACLVKKLISRHNFVHASTEFDSR